jgi:Cu-Zn family superoxide dismutase
MKKFTKKKLNKKILNEKKNTKKNYNYKDIKAVAILSPDKNIENNDVNGIVEFTQYSKYLKITYKINNLSDGEHGFHIHKFGDLRDGCNSACSHFNPFGYNHGSLQDNKSHAGDLGNIISKDNICIGVIKTNKISLNNSITNIIGRMIIVHKDRDDLGLGNNQESLKTGNAGKRLACGIIGVSN